MQEFHIFVHRPDARWLSLSFGQGPLTILALGGWVGSGEVWHELFGHLPHWRCVSVDHRGSGASTHSGPISTDAMVDDLFAVAEVQQMAAASLPWIRRAPLACPMPNCICSTASAMC